MGLPYTNKTPGLDVVVLWGINKTAGVDVLGLQCTDKTPDADVVGRRDTKKTRGGSYIFLSITRSRLRIPYHPPPLMGFPF